MNEAQIIEPGLTLWTALFLVAAAQGFFLAGILALTKRGHRKANRLLALFVLCFALTLTDYVGYWSHYNRYVPYLAGIYLPLALLFGPLLWLYLRTLLGQAPVRRVWLHFLPAGLMALMWAGRLYHRLPEVTWFFVHNTLIIAHLSLYFGLSLRLLRTQTAPPQTTPDHPEHIRRNWLRTLLTLFAGFILGYVTYFFLAMTPFFTIVQDYTISLAMTVLIYGVGVLGYLQPEIFTGQRLRPLFAPKYQTSSLTPAAAESLKESLLHLMQSEQPYRDNRLRLNTLAERLDVSPHHLSQVINEQLGINFADFVNSYRVREAQQLLADPAYRDQYIIDIAYQVGFNNKTSFNKAFKAQTGLSPSAFRNRMLALRLSNT